MGKILLLPVWVVRGVFGLIGGIFRAVFSMGRGTVRFSFRNLPGIVVGAIATLLAAKIISARKKA